MVALRSFVGCLAVACLGVAAPPSASRAGEIFWNGGAGDGLWSSAANWDLARAPANDDQLRFGGSVGLTPTNDIAGIELISINFTPGASSFTLGGQPITLGNAFYPTIGNGSSSLQTIDNAIVLEQETYISTGPAGLVLNGPIETNGFQLDDQTANGATLTINGPISGSGYIRQWGIGSASGTPPILLLGGANTYTGDTEVGGIVRTLGSNVLPDQSRMFVPTNGTLDIGAFDDRVGVVSLSGGTLTGTTGVLTGSEYRLGSGTADVILGGSANLVKTGLDSTIATLNRANLYTGTTTLTGGTLSLGASERIQDVSALIFAPGQFTQGTFQLNGFTETVASLAGTAGTVDLGSGQLALTGAASTSYSGVISGAGGSLTRAGTGVLTLNGNNTYAGTTTVSGGTLRLGNNERIADASALVVTGSGIFDLAGHTETVRSLAGNGRVTLGSGVLAVAPGSGTATSFSGVISGSGGVAKSGAGSLELTGANTYSGATTVTAGTLALPNGLGSAGAAITVTAGAELSGSGTIGRTLNNSGHVRGPNEAGKILTLGDDLFDDVTGPGSYSGNILFGADFSPGSSAAQVSLENAAFAPGARLLLELGGKVAGSDYDQLLASGTVTLDGVLLVSLIGGYTPNVGDSFTLIRAASILGSYSIVQLPTLTDAYWQIEQTPTLFSILAVPEPGTAGLLLLGLVALRFCSRTQRHTT